MRKVACSLIVALLLSVQVLAQTVYLTRTGTKYHRETCRMLGSSKAPVTLEEAVLRYEPCGICNPPTLTIGAGSAARPAQQMTAKVVGVSDGDTIKVLTNQQQVTVRLNGIDAPESRQDFGTKAKDFLSDLVFDQEVTLVVTGKDRYNRILADIYCQGMRINHVMVQYGYAWWYKQYSNDRELERLETEARRQRKGLWSKDNPIPPWDFRKGAR